MPEHDFWLLWEVEPDGRQRSASLTWGATIGPARFAVNSGVWGDTPLRADDGHLSVSLPRRAGADRRRQTLRLELTSDPDRRDWQWAPFAGDLLPSGGDYGFSSSWIDVLTYSRGAPNLVLALRDRNGTVVERIPIDRDFFARSEARIEAILAEMRAVTADFRNRCTFLADDEGPIYVT